MQAPHLTASAAAGDAERLGGDERVHLADGRAVKLAPVGVQDAAAEQAFVSALSPTSRYQRFHLGIRELSAETLHDFTHVDQHQHVAIVARPADGPSRDLIVADARYVRSADTGDAEFAVAVADAWQGAGLGRELLERLARHARAHGVRRLFGDVLWGNEPMIALMRGLGAGLALHPGDSTLVRAQFVLA